MGMFRDTTLRTAFEVLALTRVTGLIRRRSRCRGVIFALHRVLPDDPADFSPNAVLQVRPDFLEHAIQRVRELGLETVSLDEAVRRIESDAQERPFAVFTFDDAYRDNHRHALPILRRLRCPFTLYVATALVDGVGEVWWQALEDIIAQQEALALTHAGETDYIACATLSEKRAAFDQISRRMRAMPEPDRVDLIRTLAAQYSFDLEAHCRQLIMNWAELRSFVDEPLCTLGAHTVHHHDLSKLAPGDARNEIEQSMRVLKAQFGSAPEHLAFPPSGTSTGVESALARDLGFRTAVTLRPGGIHAHHRNQLHCLPRILLSGNLQARRHVDVYATGAVFPLLRTG